MGDVAPDRIILQPWTSRLPVQGGFCFALTVKLSSISTVALLPSSFYDGERDIPGQQCVGGTRTPDPLQAHQYKSLPVNPHRPSVLHKQNGQSVFVVCRVLSEEKDGC